ncbi:MAG: hypothetical protein LUH63_16540 [Parabacteroides sp.]|nr:hypothetical protein [Parabacteroides sp.]
MADEAIYHGTTFERIYSLLLTGFYLSGGNRDRSNIESIPAVISAEPQGFEEFIKIKDEHSFKISEKEIPFYIDSLITGFQALGKPYDIEFPLFYIETGLSQEENISLAVGMAGALKKHFGDNKVLSYTVDHWNRELQESENNPGWAKHIQNVSIVLDNLLSTDKGIVKPEFWKIRIFVKEGRICVASFAPHIIPGDYVSGDSSLFEGSAELKELWSEIYSKINFFHEEADIDYQQFVTRNVAQEDNDASDGRGVDYYWEQQKQEYQYHCKKTLIVSANYLLSFSYLTKVSTILRETLKNADVASCDFITDLSDLQYLFGNKLALVLKEKLDSLIFSSIKLQENIMSEVNQYELIPASYKDHFEKENVSLFLKCHSVSQLISCNFSNQHRLIELESRNRYALYDRLRFGESFSSLYRKFILFTTDEQILLRLHQGLDQRIDDGSIVPNYVCNLSLESSPFFRMFRSGENEDKQRDQLMRLVYHVVWRLTTFRDVSRVSESLLLFVFHLVFANAARVSAFRNLCGIQFKVEFDLNGKLKVLFFYGENEGQDLLQYAVDSDVLSKVEDESSGETVYLPCSNDYTEQISQTSILDVETSELIDRYVDMALLVKRKLHPYELRDLQQWYTCRKKNVEYSLKLKKWWRQIVEEFDECGQIINVEKAYRTFDRIFTLYPINDLAKERASVIEFCKAEGKTEEELEILDRIFPANIPNRRLMRIIEGAYLIFVLLMARVNQEKEDIIFYSMRKLSENFGKQYEDIEEWSEKDYDLRNEYQRDDFPCTLYNLLKTIITNYFAHERVERHLKKGTCRSVATVCRKGQWSGKERTSQRTCSI